jgi:hypothetical protein
MKCLWLVYACIFIVCYYYFLAIESNEECTEEGEISEYQEEEDQGQAIKASHLYLMHILILFTYSACIIKVYQLACFYIAIDLVAIICWLKLRKPICYHLSR